MSDTRRRPAPGERCPGRCDGFGSYPAEHGRWLTPDERLAWQLAEARDPSPNGVHYIECPVCHGTGRRR